MSFENFQSQNPENEPDKLESAEGPKENELILPEADIERAKDLLTDRGIKFYDNKYSERQQLDQDTHIPAEFILGIVNKDESHVTAEYVKEVFELLQSKEIVVRYGRKVEGL